MDFKNISHLGNSGDELYLIEEDDAVIKKCPSDERYESFSKQMNFLLKVEHNSFVKIRKLNDFSYKMPYYRKTFTKWLLDHSETECVKKFEEIINVVERYSKNNKGPVSISSYFEKLEKRLGLKFDHSEIDFEITSQFGFVHGDLTISNILMDKKDKFIFIDPRGTEEHSYYDYGKLMQSVSTGYEILMNEENEGLRKKYELFEKMLRDRLDEKLLDFFHAVHLIGAYPFLKHKNRPYSEKFLNDGIKIFKKLNIKVIK